MPTCFAQRLSSCRMGFPGEYPPGCGAQFEPFTPTLFRGVKMSSRAKTLGKPRPLRAAITGYRSSTSSVSSLHSSHNWLSQFWMNVFYNKNTYCEGKLSSSRSIRTYLMKYARRAYSALLTLCISPQGRLHRMRVPTGSQHAFSAQQTPRMICIS